MKTKTKIKTKKKATADKTKVKKTKAVKAKAPAKPVAKKPRHYHPSYLGALIAGILLLEGVLFGIATPTDWKYGIEILDLRPAMAEAAQDLAEVFSPVIELTCSVNTFYVAAADELIPMLDLSGAFEGVGTIYAAVDSFYDQASIAMADLLGISEQTYFGSVAGASTYN